MKPYMNPVDWFNRMKTMKDIFPSDKFYVDETIAKDMKSGDVYELLPEGIIESPTLQYTKFEMYTLLRHNSNPRSAYNYVEWTMMKRPLPYIRVGTDYYLVNDDQDEHGRTITNVKPWKKETIVLDYGKDVLKDIGAYIDFCMVPSNTNYQRMVNLKYNRYNPFPHFVDPGPVTKEDFSHIDLLMRHIFGDQVELGYRYLKVLYEKPEQKLPVIVLTSKERQTGKTTFLNLLEIIFGPNYVTVRPEDIAGNFNSSYALKNIIGIDETVIEKQHVVEKIKSIVTAKKMMVNDKFVSHYEAPFYGKVVLCTNRENDFMRIDQEEIRFWVRKVPTLPTIITDIEAKMYGEVPALIRYLIDNVAPVDYSRSRMVFTVEEIRTEAIEEVKAESKSGLAKELTMLIEDLFLQNERLEEFNVLALDIKERWFKFDSQISANYIGKVLRNDLYMTPLGYYKSYYPWGDGTEKAGNYYTFKRTDFIKDRVEKDEYTDYNLPF